jgi:hypothetical protein
MSEMTFGLAKKRRSKKRKMSGAATTDKKKSGSSRAKSKGRRAPETAAEKRIQAERKKAQNASRGGRKTLREAKAAYKETGEKGSETMSAEEVAKRKAAVQEARQATKGIRTARKKASEAGIRPKRKNPPKPPKKTTLPAPSGSGVTSSGTPGVVGAGYTGPGKPKPAKPVKGYSATKPAGGQKVPRGRSAVPGGTDGGYKAPRIAGSGKKRK